LHYQNATRPPLREAEQRPSLQAVGERGRDENLEKGAAHQLMMTTFCRVCFRKILQRDFLTCRSSRSTSSDSSKTVEHQESIKKRRFERKIAL
jgi:hypothetical protein